MMKKEIQKRAKELFEKSKYKKLYANASGEFFTQRDLAVSSVKKPEDLIEILPADVLDPIDDSDPVTVTLSDQGMVITADDGKDIVFFEKKEINEPQKGDKATIDGKPADGVFKLGNATLGFKKGSLDKLSFKRGTERKVIPTS